MSVITINRKECAKKSKKVLKAHYVLLVIACLFAAFIGSEYTNSIRSLRSAGTEETSGNGVASVMDFFQTESAMDTLQDMLSGQVKKGEENATKDVDEAKENATSVLGRTNGVFSQVVNSVTSGGMFVTIQRTVSKLSGSTDIGLIIMVILALIFYAFMYFFVKDIYLIIMRRVFLEARTYETVPMGHFAFVFKMKKWAQSAWNMFVLSVYTTLWSLTIVGGFIKTYSYYLVPFILAENPDMKANQAITLSRKMMDGHKMECFLYDLSFIGWEFLSALTFGLLGILFANPYKTAFFSEYYVKVREMAKENNVEGIEALCDDYLYAKPDKADIWEAYEDIIDLIQEPLPEPKPLTGMSGFLERNFGILISYREEEKEYERKRANRYRINLERSAVRGECYPYRLYFLKSRKGLEWKDTYFMRNYSLASLILIFFIVSFGGWLWEVALTLIRIGKFSNRGVLHGPWLPIYGTGVILILILLKRFREKPIVEFSTAIVLCGFVEFMTSYVLEITAGKRWWDYTGYFLNIQGRICAEGLLVFGLGGIAAVYLLAPAIDDQVRKIKGKVLTPICLSLVLIFAADSVYSKFYPNEGEGITDDASTQ